jgi:hypothetical protein
VYSHAGLLGHRSVVRLGFPPTARQIWLVVPAILFYATDRNIQQQRKENRHMKYQTRNQAKIVLWVVALIFFVAQECSFSVVHAYDNPFDNQSMLSQADWLNGYGVDVYYNFSYTPDTRFSAIELPTRLYAKRLGYPSNWYVSTPQQFKSRVESGFEDLIFYPNGGDVGPEMGDILLWDDHVAVIDQVYTGTLGIVQQNIWSVYDSTGVPIATDTIAYFAEENYYAIQGVIGMAMG